MRTLAVGAVLLALSAPAATAKEGGVVARIATPIPRSADPGSKVTVVWTLTVLEAGKRRPYSPGYVFVQLFGARPGVSSRAYGTHAGRRGRYRATLRVPPAGVERVAIGVVGVVCRGTPRSCQPRPKFFRIAGPALR